MAYQLDRFNGTFLVNVEDGSIESNSTDLRFVGKNYAGYGEVQNENFLHLLENFANTTPPPKVLSGQIWYDNANKKLKFYDGTKFRVAGGSEIGATAPAGLATGEFWFDTSAKQLYTWTGTDFVLIGPEASPDLGSAAATSQVVKDTLGNNHTILKLSAGGKTVIIINQDDDFTLDSSINPIEDFSIIKKGANLVRTNTSGVSQDNYVFWGSASNAQRLGGRPSSDFLTNPPLPFTGEVNFRDPGYTLGDGNDLRVRVENNDEVIFENRLGNDITFRITIPPNDRRNVAVFRSSGVFPGDDLIYDLGSNQLKWKNIWAGTVTSTFVGNLTGNTVGSHRGNVLANDTEVLIDAQSKQIGYTGANIVGTLTGSVAGDVVGTSTNTNFLDNKPPSVGLSLSAIDTIPVRTSTGEITAVRFIGTADRTDRLKISNSATDTDPDYRSAKTDPEGNSIAARDIAGDLYAGVFQGTATAARYADLAEKYITDKFYEIGTVVTVGGSAEVRSSMSGDRALGAISSNPAFMMNKDLENGQYVALKGRLPIKVKGAIKKGDRLIAADDGCATKSDRDTHVSVFAISLEDSDDETVKLIEAVIL
jgi:hypothetical protein